MAAQLDHVRRWREEVARSAAAAEAAAVTREQDLNRRAAELAGRAAALDRREADLARRAAELGRRAAEVDRTEEALARRRAEADEVEDALRDDYDALERDLAARRRAAAGEAVFRRPEAGRAAPEPRG